MNSSVSRSLRREGAGCIDAAAETSNGEDRTVFKDPANVGGKRICVEVKNDKSKKARKELDKKEETVILTGHQK